MTLTETPQLPLPPGNFGLPLLGETLEFLSDKHFADKRQKEYGSIFKTHLFGRPAVVVIGAEANRSILTENQAFEATWPYSTRVLLGAGSLSMQTGSIHQKRRKLLFQAFQPRALADYTSTMEKITNCYLSKWEQMRTLTWYPELRNYTFDIACQLLIGNDANLGRLFKDFSDGLFTIPIQLPWTKFGKAVHARQQLLIKIEEIILQRQQKPNSTQDVLGILLEAKDEDGSQLSIDELKDQLLTLLFAGHETLTSGIASFCLLLSQNQPVLQKIRAEQQHLNINEPLTIEHLKQMTYLDQVIKEVLRIVPPVAGGFREVIKPFELNGYLIPQGWSVLYQISRTHQDASVYTHPEVFDPDRFSPERAEDKPKPFSHIAFGGGMRECIGKEFARLEMKIFAALLVRNYEWELLPNQNLNLVMIPTPHPQDGLRVSLRQYHQN